MQKEQVLRISKRCVLLVLAIVLICNVGIVNEAQAATVEINQADFLAAANGQIGAGYSTNLCLAWVANFWTRFGVEFSSSCCAHGYSLGANRIVSTSRSNIPIGANIYLYGGSVKCGTCGSICGHIGIHIGNGKVVSTRTLRGESTKVGVETIEVWESWGYKYAGWGWHSGVKVVVNDYTTVDSTARIGVSKKDSSAEDQCYIKEKPFEDSATKSVTGKGETVKIIGAVKNKYDNIWYKTSDGHYVYSGDVTVYEYSNLFSLSANFKNKKDQNAHVAPDAGSEKIKAYPAGNSFQVKAFVTNSHGNIWAELANGGYMNFYDLGSDLLNMDFVSHVTTPTHSTTYPSGNINVSNQGFWLKGPIEAQMPFLTVSTRIVNRESGKDVEGRSPITVQPTSNQRKIDLNETKYNGKTLDSQTVFTNLPKGWYRYELNAQFGFTYQGNTFKFGNVHNFVSSDFTVGNPGTSGAIMEIEIVGATKPSKLKTGAPFEMEGVVKTSGYLTSVSATIWNVDANGNKTSKALNTASRTFSGSSTTSHDISKSVNYDVIFNALKAGQYSYVIEATYVINGAQKTKSLVDCIFAVSADGKTEPITPGTATPAPTVAPTISPELKGNLTIGTAVQNENILEIPVGIQGNPGLIGISMDITVPDAFTGFNIGTIDVGKNAVPYTDGMNGGTTVSLMSLDKMTGDGNLFKIYLDIEGVDLKEFTIKVKCLSAGDSEGKNVMFSATEKKIQLASNRVPGDADENGIVDWGDLILILKYVSLWDVSINLSNAEVTGNGVVNWDDLILLLKYVSLWDVQLK